MEVKSLPPVLLHETGTRAAMATAVRRAMNLPVYNERRNIGKIQLRLLKAHKFIQLFCLYTGQLKNLDPGMYISVQLPAAIPVHRHF